MFLSEDEIKFEPSYTDFETVFLAMYDLIIAKCSHLPRIEAKLFSDRATVRTALPVGDLVEPFDPFRIRRKRII